MIIPIKTEEELVEFYEMLLSFPKDQPLSPIAEIVSDIVDQAPNQHNRSKNVNYILQKITEHNRKDKLAKLLS